MRFVPLASGSRGNATLVEFGSTRLLVDAGLSARELAGRLESVGVAPESVTAILLTHEHQDHARGARRFSQRHRVPVACSPATLEALELSPAHLAGWLVIGEAEALDLGAVRVEAVPVPHDAARPVSFVLHGEGLRVGIVTDIGHATALVVARFRGCHVLLVEFNHDDGMLRDGPYPWHLKQRVGGRLGHLSNDEAAALLRSTVGPDSQAVVLGHLSEKNNTPQLARQTAARALAEVRQLRVAMRVASPHRPTPAVEL